MAATKAEIAWAAGLFEGEGSLVPRRNGLIIVVLAMTDKDVVERFHRIVGMGTISERAAGRWAPLWVVTIRKTDEVLRVIRLLRPYLGARRRARADELEAALRRHIDEVTAPRRCRGCPRVFRPPFTSTAKARQFCDTDCARTYRNRIWSERRRKAA